MARAAVARVVATGVRVVSVRVVRVRVARVVAAARVEARASAKVVVVRAAARVGGEDGGEAWCREDGVARGRW